jgi:hypothetical protein
MVSDYMGVTHSLGKAYSAIAVTRASADLQLDEATSGSHPGSDLAQAPPAANNH